MIVACMQVQQSVQPTPSQSEEMREEGVTIDTLTWRVTDTSGCCCLWVKGVQHIRVVKLMVGSVHSLDSARSP